MDVAISFLMLGTVYVIFNPLAGWVSITQYRSTRLLPTSFLLDENNIYRDIGYIFLMQTNKM
jgi:hypothetical protein